MACCWFCGGSALLAVSSVLLQCFIGIADGNADKKHEECADIIAVVVVLHGHSSLRQLSPEVSSQCTYWCN